MRRFQIVSEFFMKISEKKSLGKPLYGQEEFGQGDCIFES